MNIGKLKRFVSDDFYGAPPWFRTFLDNINPIVDSLNSLLNGNIDTTFNLQVERQVVSLQHGVSYTVKLAKLTVTPFHMRVGYASGYLVDSYGITGYNTDATFNITVNFVGAPSGNITTYIILEP